MNIRNESNENNHSLAKIKETIRKSDLINKITKASFRIFPKNQCKLYSRLFMSMRNDMFYLGNHVSIFGYEENNESIVMKVQKADTLSNWLYELRVLKATLQAIDNVNDEFYYCFPLETPESIFKLQLLYLKGKIHVSKYEDGITLYDQFRKNEIEKNTFDLQMNDLLFPSLVSLTQIAIGNMIDDPSQLSRLAVPSFSDDLPLSQSVKKKIIGVSTLERGIFSKPAVHSSKSEFHSDGLIKLISIDDVTHFQIIFFNKNDAKNFLMLLEKKSAKQEQLFYTKTPTTQREVIILNEEIFKIMVNKYRDYLPTKYSQDDLLTLARKNHKR